MKSTCLNDRPDEEGIKTYGSTNIFFKYCLNDRPDEEGIKTYKLNQ